MSEIASCGARVALVAGGAGFLGAALCARLLREGAFVVCLDNLWTGRREAIAPLLGHRRFQFVLGDVRALPALPGPLPTEIWNLACPASPTVWPRDPAGVLTTSVQGTHALLALAAASGARLLHASTSEIYGDPAGPRQHEDDPGRVHCTGPRACYQEGKRAAEALCAIAREAGQDVRVARLFNTYGPGMRADDGRVVPAFVAAALAGSPLLLHGDGSQTRCFCFIDDMLDGLCGLMALPTCPPPVNLGSDAPVSMRALALLVQDLAGSPALLESTAARPDDPRHRCPDLTRARRLLGWAPLVGLRQGLAACLAACLAEAAAPQPRAAEAVTIG
jgi:UDP-glucuronate decarboxylase